MLATIEQVKAQVYAAHSADDALLTGYLEAASEAVCTYLRVAEADVPAGASFAARQATVILVAEWFKNREAEQQGQVPAEYGYGYLPQPVIALLYPHRDPAVA